MFGPDLRITESDTSVISTSRAGPVLLLTACDHVPLQPEVVQGAVSVNGEAFLEM